MAFLRAQQDRLKTATPKARPWQYSALHNPWGPCAQLYDAWGFLDLCQAPEIIDRLIPLMGPDIILYDTQLTPDPWTEKLTRGDRTSDRLLCPVEPLAGFVVRIAFGPPGREIRNFIYRPASHKGPTPDREPATLPIQSGQMIIHDIRLDYRIDDPSKSTRPLEFLIRYFPATSHYIREASAPVHQALCERAPLLNYARLPLWLVHGTDRAGNDFVTGFNPRPGQWAGDAVKTPD